MPQGAVTSVTLRSTEFNEEDVISSFRKATAEKGFGKQRRGYFSRTWYNVESLSKRILHKEEAGLCFSKKSKVMD